MSCSASKIQKCGCYMQPRHDVLDGLLGVCVGDALGVPVEFFPRTRLKQTPVQDMLGHGTHNQVAGTWSDDSSLTFCLVESLCHGFDLIDIAKRFARWVSEGYWTPHGKVFDIGNTTLDAIIAIRQGISPTKTGRTDIASNGNGSLMRILPMAYYAEKDAKILEYTHSVSSITHAHPYSQMACGMYVVLATYLLSGEDPISAYAKLRVEATKKYSESTLYSHELAVFSRILDDDVSKLPEKEISSNGYVISTLMASIWCLCTSTSYAETVLKAVNLGDDTDTTAAVAGGLAGIYYGWKSIPSHWISQLAHKDDIFELAKRWENVLYPKNKRCREHEA